MNYKAPDNTLHFLDDDSFAHLLPAGSVAITDAESEALRPKPAELTYAQKRVAEYPSFADQFDLLYHGGMDAWKAAIDVVKNKYPKE
jgi:hypothetical protein